MGGRGGLDRVGDRRTGLGDGDHDWNREVSSEPADARSNAYLAFMGASWRNLHADFGANPIYGVPFVVVPGSNSSMSAS